MSDGNLPDRLRARCFGKPATIPWPHRILHEAADEIETLQAENARMREALEPFAAIADIYTKYWDDDDPDSFLLISDCDKKETHVTLGMCRKARAALSADDTEGESND